MSRNWDSDTDGDLLRFSRLEATRAEHILYATRLAPGMLLGLVFDAETPFGTIRSQAGKLGSLLDREEPGPAPEPEVVSTTPLRWTPSRRRPLRPGPDCERSRTRTTSPSRRFRTSCGMCPRQNRNAVVQPPPPSIRTRPAAPSFRASPALAGRDRCTTAPPSSRFHRDRRIQTGRPVRRRPWQRPWAEQMDHTLPHSLVGFAGTGAEARRINLEPVQAGVYHLTYACLLLPRFCRALPHRRSGRQALRVDADHLHRLRLEA